MASLRLEAFPAISFGRPSSSGSKSLVYPSGRSKIRETKFPNRVVVALAVKREEKSESGQPTAEASPLVKAAWYGSEAFGKVVALVRGKPQEEEGTGASGGEEEATTISRAEAVAALRSDYDRSYFVTGQMTMHIYEEECEFADPFVSFKGTKRFKENVSNLGSFIEDANLKVLDWQDDGDKITAKWRFSCVLGLPWRPILAASGNTQHYFDASSGKIYRHVEMWDISPMDGLRQLFKPNPKPRKR